jgi:hypothetical protein
MMGGRAAGSTAFLPPSFTAQNLFPLRYGISLKKKTSSAGRDEPGDHDEWPRKRNRDVRQFAPSHPIEHGSGDQSDSERNPQCDFAISSRPKTANDAADPGDPTIGEPKHG